MPLAIILINPDTTGSAKPPLRFQFTLELSNRLLNQKNIEEELSPREHLSRLIEPLKILLNVGKAFSEVCSDIMKPVFRILTLFPA
jgi:hypothetical protein